MEPPPSGGRVTEDGGIQMQENRHIELCYCGNGRIFPQVLLSVLSVVEHASLPVHIHLLTMDLTSVDGRFTPFSPLQCEILNEVVSEKYPESSVRILDVKDPYIQLLGGGKNERGFYTPYAQLRLLADCVDLPEKFLYLDTDTMCCGDLKELWENDVSGYEFAAVKDKEGKFWICPDYCNSGVLLVNVPFCRETGLFERVRRRVRTRRMIMPDQSALNFLAKRKLILPRRFNEQGAIRADTVVKHFCRGFRWYGPFFRIYNIKQTDRENVHRKLNIFCFDDLYEKYDLLQQKYGF